ncbi:MAG: acylglycerol kinase family protein, partial [Planctomycetaceae bacterium]|nr:acylglycerol kinase family protein [Planctomycetaceae bacterium]
MRKHILISVNPKAGRTSPMLRAEELQKRLQEKGFQVELGTDLSEITGKANELQQNGQLRALVGVGGDGTAAELVNRTEPGTPILLLAAGTANLLSKHFRWGSTP